MHAQVVSIHPTVCPTRPSNLCSPACLSLHIWLSMASKPRCMWKSCLSIQPSVCLPVCLSLHAWLNMASKPPGVWKSSLSICLSVSSHLAEHGLQAPPRVEVLAVHAHVPCQSIYLLRQQRHWHTRHPTSQRPGNPSDTQRVSTPGSQLSIQI
jgi:hypothetical protein